MFINSYLINAKAVLQRLCVGDGWLPISVEFPHFFSPERILRQGSRQPRTLPRRFLRERWLPSFSHDPLVLDTDQKELRENPAPLPLSPCYSYRLLFITRAKCTYDNQLIHHIWKSVNCLKNLPPPAPISPSSSRYSYSPIVLSSLS